MRYFPIGYYNDAEDIKELKDLSAEEIVEYYKEKKGAFHTIPNPEDDTMIDTYEEDLDAEYIYTKDRKYIVHKPSCDDIDIYEDGTTDVFFDIYELDEDSAVYVVESEWEGKHWEHTNEVKIFANEESAKSYLKEKRETLLSDLKRMADSDDEIDIEQDSSNHFFAEYFDYEYWVEVSMRMQTLFR